ncbi:hypothetical protein AVEN_57896-1 [Araneus ventricosus]|uniref:Uncharacterized protein n=1 Tax=Araneus ventricosus TaxID=182803 RepID=A0A4Y2N8A9_ARAVE|nr:hypothetical protein AVEN_57896-1 [Araneus ventricosus]
MTVYFLVDIRTIQPPASDSLLNMILCFGLEINLIPMNGVGNMTDRFLVPIRTTQSPASGSPLNMIFSSSNKGCGSACGYRKLGLNCSIACANCHGQSCLNAAPIEEIPE